MARLVALTAAVALLAGVACAAENEVQSSKLFGRNGLIPKLWFLNHNSKAALEGMTLAKVAEQINPDKRGRMLAQHTVCDSLGNTMACEAHKTNGACGSASGCAWDTTENKCGAAPAADGEMDAMAAQLLMPMFALMGPQIECPSKTASAECTGDCKWSDTATPKCGLSQAAVDTAIAGMSDPAAKAIYALSFKCSMVIGDDKPKCDADKDCKYVPAPAANSTRKLLGSEDGEESGASCDPTELASSVAIASQCPTQFEAMSATALADPTVPESEKKVLRDAAAAAAAAPVASGAASAASMVAAAVIATAAALFAL